MKDAESLKILRGIDNKEVFSNLPHTEHFLYTENQSSSVSENGTGGDKQEWNGTLEKAVVSEVAPVTQKQKGVCMGDLRCELKQFKRLDCPIVLDPSVSTDIDVVLHAYFRQRLSQNYIEKNLRYKRFMEKHRVPVEFYPPRYENFIHHMDAREMEGATPYALKHEKQAIMMFAKAFGMEDIFKKYKLPHMSYSPSIDLPFPYTVKRFWTYQYYPNIKSYMNKLVQTLHFHNFMIGMRAPSELANMKVSNVEIDERGNGIIKIVQQKRHGKLRIISPRKEVLSSHKYKSFKNWIDHWRPKVENQYSGDYLYLKPDGRPFTPANLGKLLRETGKKIYPKYHPYVGRHWNAVAMLIETKISDGNFDIYKVNRWMDHANIQTTMGYVRYAEMYYEAYPYSWFEHSLKHTKKISSVEDRVDEEIFPEYCQKMAHSGKLSPVERSWARRDSANFIGESFPEYLGKISHSGKLAIQPSTLNPFFYFLSMYNFSLVDRGVDGGRYFLAKTIRKVRVYEYLIEGYAQSRIAKLLGVSRQRINTITKELIKGGYIKAVNPDGNPKIYEATDKPYVLKDGLRWGRENSPLERCRVHNVSYAFKVVIPPRTPVKWDSESELNNGVTQHSLFYPFEGLGKVTFKRIVGKKEDKLIVWLPSIVLSREELPNYDKIIRSYCHGCANWFMKRYHCRLEPVGLYQKPHFAILDTIEAKVLSKYGNFSIGEHTWVDCSEGSPEWETDVLEYALIRMGLPEWIWKKHGLRTDTYGWGKEGKGEDAPK